MLLNRKFWIWTRVEWVLPPECSLSSHQIYPYIYIFNLSDQPTNGKGRKHNFPFGGNKTFIRLFWENLIWCVLGVLWDLCRILQPTTWGQEISYCCIPGMVSVISTFRSEKTCLFSSGFHYSSCGTEKERVGRQSQWAEKSNSGKNHLENIVSHHAFGCCFVLWPTVVLRNKYFVTSFHETGAKEWKKGTGEAVWDAQPRTWDLERSTYGSVKKHVRCGFVLELFLTLSPRLSLQRRSMSELPRLSLLWKTNVSRKNTPSPRQKWYTCPHLCGDMTQQTSP